MIKAISNLDNNSKSMKGYSSKHSMAVDLPHAKKMNKMEKDTFKRNGILCGVDLSFEDA